MYQRELGGTPPRAFMEAYELLCDAFYDGALPQPELPPERVKTSGAHQLWFRGDILYDFKLEVDRFLVATRKAIRLWSRARARQAASRQTAPRDGGDDLASPRGARHLSAVPDRQEA